MTAFQGADTAQLREQDQAITTGAGALGDRVGSALDLARQVAWVGADADAFRSRCEEVRSRLEDALEELRRHGAELVDHAEEQDTASDAATDGGGSVIGPLGDLIEDLFSPTSPGLSPEDFWGPIKSPLGPLRDLVDDLGLSRPSGFDPQDYWGPIEAPAGPVRDWIQDRFFSEDRYSIIDRAVNWGQKTGGDLWEWSMDQADAAKSSKLARFAKHGVPVLPDLAEVSTLIGQGKTDQAYATMLRASVEMIPGVSWVDLGLGEATGQLGDEHKVFDSDIRWNEGTPLEVLFEYGAQKSDEAGLMEPGEKYGERWADKLGVDNGIARNTMSSIGGIGMYGLMSSAPVTAIEIGTDIPLRQKIWDGLNAPVR